MGILDDHVAAGITSRAVDTMPDTMRSQKQEDDAMRDADAWMRSTDSPQQILGKKKRSTLLRSCQDDEDSLDIPSRTEIVPPWWKK